MQDNARCHISSDTKLWLQRNEIPVLDWPTYSPDLNLIENLWGTLTNVVYAEGKQYKKIKDLEIAVQLAWRNIQIEQLQVLSMSIPNKINEVILSKGCYTKY